MLAGFWDHVEQTSAECIRSFPVVPFVGSEWLTLQDAFTEHKHKVEKQTPRKLHFKVSELYGWRGADPRVYYLSPWEFVKWWDVKILQPPNTTQPQKQCLSEWTAGHDGKAKPQDNWKFGRGFVWKAIVPPELQESIVRFPAKKHCAEAAKYYLQRRTEPHVPFPTSCPLPKPDMSKEEQARLLNVYLRPWTLDSKVASLHVPHIKALNLSFEARQVVKPVQRILGKSSPGTRSHRAAWQEYITKHVVSQHAAHTIQNFLAAAECSPEEVDAIEPKSAASKDGCRHQLDKSFNLTQINGSAGFEYSKRCGPAVQQILQQWKTQTSEAFSPAWHVNQGLDELDAPVQPGPGQSVAQPNPVEPVLWSYGTLTPDNVAAWRQQLLDNDPECRPTQEQMQFLDAVADRCLREAQEEHKNHSNRTEPLRAFLHGVPGAGKSQTLKWMRQFFESVCGWSHQKEFVFLAPQNTQAALIDGMALHSFANIRIKGKGRTTSSTLGPEQHAQYQHLRWIILDECSTVPLEALATLQKRLSDSVRSKNTWKQRGQGVDRPFAGVNLLIAGDFWQFGAVKATSIFQNPFAKGHSIQVANLQKIIWSSGEQGIHQLFELTQEQRCQDPWLSAVLSQARHGNMTQETWSFLHGFPTLHPGSWNPTTNQIDCHNPHCATLTAAWESSVQVLERTPWQERVAQECVVCQQERARRALVGKNQKAEKILLNPFVHGLNAAKYVAANLRARWVAQMQKQVLLWVVAQDTPLFHMDTD
eukprot:s3057_g17.t1